MGATGMNHPKVSTFSTSLEPLALNHNVKLVTADDKEMIIAEFHPRHYFVEKQKARLDIQPAGMDMLDYIVSTFVFAERKRRERERRAQ